MKNSLKYFTRCTILCIFFSINLNGQSRTSASIDIRINIVNSLSPTLVQNGILPEVDSREDISLSRQREVLVRFHNKVRPEKNSKNILKMSNLRVFDSNNEEIGRTDLNNTMILKNVSLSQKLQFVPSTNSMLKENSFEPSIIIVY